MKLRGTLLAGYIVANAVLYSSLLPLWEGFDEPFHFGYVQQLANGQEFPDPRSSELSREVGASILLAPAGRPVQMNIPAVRNYAEYFGLPRERRAGLRADMERIPPEWRRQGSQFINYEGQQTPLAYLAMAPVERALAGVPIRRRVLALRILVALVGAGLLYAGAVRLLAQLGIGGAYRDAALFCLFSLQMIWAAMAHVANDWLAIPLGTWLLVGMVRYSREPGTRLKAACPLALGLLTKAYFVVFVPLALGLCVAKKRWRDLGVVAGIPLIVAGPWYARNLLRYGALISNTQTRAGVGIAAVIHAAPGLPWARMAWASVRSALWTGNNTFEAFSVTTVGAIAAVWLVALMLWARTKLASAEWISGLFCALFIAALGYDAAIESIYAHTVAGAEPWYSQLIAAPMIGLAFLGCMRWKRPGRAVAVSLTGLLGYVLIATYVLKLIPLYGGFAGRASAGSVVSLYSTRLPSLIDNLNLVALAPAGVLLSLAVIVAALAITQMAVLFRSIN